MGKKALKYLIILLIVPIIISIIIAISTGQADGSSTNNRYDSITGEFNDNGYTKEEQVKRSNPYIYLSVFIFVVSGVCVWVYLKKKESIW